VDRVDETFPLSHYLEQARGHAPPEDGVQEEQRVALRGVLLETRTPQHEVHLLERALDQVQAGRQGGPVDYPDRAGLAEVEEPRPQKVYQLLVADVTGGGNRDALRAVLRAEVVQHRIPVERLDDLAVTQDRATERMLRPDPLGEEVVDHVVGRILHHPELLEDDRLLALDVPAVEPGMEEDVGQEVGSERQVLVEHRHVEAGVLLRGERIHLAAD
jgi:hypothetical protein